MSGYRIETILVDDEGLARDRLRDLLSPFDEIKVIGEAEDGDAALELIGRARPDLVFLDIQMPGRSGLEVAGALSPPRPKIVFCTAYDEYAVEAFDRHAVDYLLKPVSRERLARALERVKQAFPDPQAEEEMKSAEETQARLFPQVLPELTTLDYFGACRPARGVGGDYYDFLPLEKGLLGVALADVSGKGLAAALLMAGLQGRLRSQASRYPNRLDRLVSTLNRSMFEATENNKFVTLFYGVYDDRKKTLRYVNAGHNPPFLLSKNGTEIAKLEKGGGVIGLFPHFEYEMGEVEMSGGELLVVYSDGVTETMGPGGEEFGEDRLLEILREARQERASSTVERIVRALDRFREPGPLHDDLTIIAAQGRVA